MSNVNCEEWRHTEQGKINTTLEEEWLKRLLADSTRAATANIPWAMARNHNPSCISIDKETHQLVSSRMTNEATRTGVLAIHAGEIIDDEIMLLILIPSE